MKKYKIKKCYLCNATEFERVKGKVRDLPEMPILKCKQCELVFLENFEHIDGKFYEESRMRDGENIEDWKMYLKECAQDDARRAEMLKLNIAGKNVLDFGCGGGGFLKRIKDVEGNCSGVEKDLSLQRLILEEYGIDVCSDISRAKGKFDFITMFHVLEHFKDPQKILSCLAKRLTAEGRIVIEVPNENDALLSLYACEPFSEFTYWGCHLYYFNVNTLRTLVNSAGLYNTPQISYQWLR